MIFFRKKTIFHREEAIPDPEELKLRFRRRILLFALLFFMALVGIPVVRDLRPSLHTKGTTRVFGEYMLETRLLAVQRRAPISLTLENGQWTRAVHSAGENCASAVVEKSAFVAPEGRWFLQKRGADGAVKSLHTVCFHPLTGLQVEDGALQPGESLDVYALPLDAESEAAQIPLSTIRTVGDGTEIRLVNL